MTRNRISCSFLCGFLLIIAAITLTLFLPSQTTLAARQLAGYYPQPQGIVGGGGELEGQASEEKEQSKGSVWKSQPTNSGSAKGESTTSSTVQEPPLNNQNDPNAAGPPPTFPRSSSNFRNGPPSFRTSSNFANGPPNFPRPSSNFQNGPPSFRSTSSNFQNDPIPTPTLTYPASPPPPPLPLPSTYESSYMMSSSSNGNGFTNEETAQTSSTRTVVTYGRGGFTCVTVSGNSNNYNEAPCGSEEAANYP